MILLMAFRKNGVPVASNGILLTVVIPLANNRSFNIFTHVHLASVNFAPTRQGLKGNKNCTAPYFPDKQNTGTD